jgi:hypothetical protein
MKESFGWYYFIMKWIVISGTTHVQAGEKRQFLKINITIVFSGCED